MIINQYQPIEELQRLLPEEEYHSMNIILDTLDVTKKHSIKSDLETLGYIHHALNLDQYSKKEFRKKLFEKIPPQLQQKYFKEQGISPNSSFKDSVKQSIEFDWGNNDKTKKFVSFFGYPTYLLPLEEREKNKLEPYKMLFDFQSGIVFQTLKKIEYPMTRALIQMPTGTGKTRTAMDIIVRLLNDNNNLQVIWFANREELLDQAYESFMHVWKHAGKFDDIRIIRLWGENDVDSIPNNKCIIFAGFQKFQGKKHLKINPDYIFVDEAHQILAPTYEDTLDSLIDFQKQTRVIGLTATPGRGINEIQNNRLVSKFHGNIVSIKFYDEEVEEKYENNIVGYLEDREILSKAIPAPLKTDVEIDLTDDEWKYLTKLVEGDYPPDFNERILKKLATDNARNMLIIDELKKYSEAKKKILYFSTNKSQSILVFTILQKLGIKAVHVDGDTDKKFRKQIIEKFKNTDEINVICNYDIFSTGFDVPNLDVVFIARPVNSPVLFNQMVGRGTRGIKMGGEESFILVQVIDKIKSRFVDFDPYSQYGYWDTNWKNY